MSTDLGINIQHVHVPVIPLGWSEIRAMISSSLYRFNSAKKLIVSRGDCWNAILWLGREKMPKKNITSIFMGLESLYFVYDYPMLVERVTQSLGVILCSKRESHNH